MTLMRQGSVCITEVEFDEMLATTRNMPKGPDSLVHSAFRCAGGMGAQHLFDAYQQLLDGAAIRKASQPAALFF